MPLYEYKCSTCGKVFETIQRFSDAPLEIHENCGGKLERLVSVSALKFKGSGWYVNDYAKSGSSSRSDSGEKKSSEKSEKSEKSSETKSESSSNSSGDSKTSESKPAPAKSDS